MSLFLWGVAAYTAPSRKNPDVTTLMHELANLTMTTTDQFYIFMWIAVTVMALRPATQLVKHNPFPRWWGYLWLWITSCSRWEPSRSSREPACSHGTASWCSGRR